MAAIDEEGLERPGRGRPETVFDEVVAAPSYRPGDSETEPAWLVGSAVHRTASNRILKGRLGFALVLVASCTAEVDGSKTSGEIPPVAVPSNGRRSVRAVSHGAL
jgi:hypothetical protein